MVCDRYQLTRSLGVGGIAKLYTLQTSKYRNRIVFSRVNVYQSTLRCRDRKVQDLVIFGMEPRVENWGEVFRPFHQKGQDCTAVCLSKVLDGMEATTFIERGIVGRVYKCRHLHAICNQSLMQFNQASGYVLKFV